MDLSGRAAFVTGGSGDLGAAICERLARTGCDVAVGYVGNTDGAERWRGW
jgi:3-oxoacyl-[acyl-carrier protein] reductase